ncbi:hypothetical protein PAXINDRAFT_97198 [Paxillus involutus ATCC 200175]|nr:hypothetical protein PAXINDRAFT_97198 [Paxillus involutus ATCC 200175]
MSSSQPLIQSTNPLGEDGVVRCHHGEHAARRTSHTVSNPDREFYCCSRHSNDSTRCKFFYWVDDPMFRREELHPPSQEQTADTSTPRPSQRARAVAARSTATPQSTPQTQVSTAALESPGKRKRLEDIQAGLAQVNEVIPPLRLFSQPSTQGPSQLSQGGPLNTPQSSPYQKYSSSPSIPETPSKRKRIEGDEAGLRSARGTRTPQPSPRKPGSSFVPSIAETPRTRARLEAIEGGLRARNEDQTSARAGPSFHAQNAIPGPSSSMPSLAHTQEVSMPSSFPVHPSSPASTDIDWDKELPPATPTHARYSFLGLPLSQGSTTPAIEPATPKNRSSSPLLDFNGNVNSESPNSLLPTPPQTTQRRTGPTLTYPGESNSNIRADPRTSTRRKGKERARPEWDVFIETDEENPFDESTSAHRSRTQSQDNNTLPRLARAAPRTSLDSDGSPTTTDQIAANIVGINQPIRALQAYMDSLEQLDAVKYIEKLDREKQALVLGHEAKKKRIEALSVELDAVREQLRK